jgi:hypothetical protein
VAAFDATPADLAIAVQILTDPPAATAPPRAAAKAVSVMSYCAAALVWEPALALVLELASARVSVPAQEQVSAQVSAQVSVRGWVLA